MLMRPSNASRDSGQLELEQGQLGFLQLAMKERVVFIARMVVGFLTALLRVFLIFAEGGLDERKKRRRD